MSVIGSNVLAGASGGAGEFQIERSLRFNSADSAYLSRTPSSAGNRKTWTWSGWVKRSKLGATQYFFGAVPSSSAFCQFGFNNDDTLRVQFRDSSANANSTTDAVFRDASAWYHIVFYLDTTQSTASDRMKTWVNGVEQTFSTDARSSITQNGNYEVNNTSQHVISSHIPYDTAGYFDGYLAEVHFVDGSQLAASDFGEYDDNNVWQPKAYSGTYGTNGFYLDFSDNSSNAALGTDSSGNSNTWTVYNLIANRNEPYAYMWSGTFLAGEPGKNAFDGSSVSAARPDSSQTVTWTHPTGIAFTKLRIRAAQSGSGTTISVNGTNVTSSFSTKATVDLTSTITSPLTTISLTATASERPKLFFVEINDVILVSGHNTDVFLDSPVNYEASSGNNGGNYCTWNPVQITFATTSFSNGNLDSSLQFTNGATVPYAVGTIAVSSGRWYWEIALTQESNDTEYIGVIDGSKSGGAWVFADIGAYLSDARKTVGTTPSSYGATYTTGDVLGIALDADNGSLTFYKNGTSQGVAVTGMTLASYRPFTSCNGTSTAQLVSANFGQRPFVYTPPTGYLSLCTQNLADPTIADGSTAMNVALYDGNDSTNAITGLGFSPDALWLKNRASGFPALANTVVGANYFLRTNGANSESGPGYSDDIVSFDSDGFTLGADTYYAFCNRTPNSYVAWAWDAGANSSKTYAVTVVSSQFRFDGFGSGARTLDLEEGSTYVFDQSDSSNATHPLRFSTTSDGTHGGGSEYTTGVTTTGTPGQAGAKTTIVVAAGAPILYYYCSTHSGMGGQADTNSTAGASNFDGTIQTTCRANPSAGFSIVGYAGGSGSGTIGHQLGAEPYFGIFKNRDVAESWGIYHKSIGNDKHLLLTTAGQATSSHWQSTNPTSSVFSLGYNGSVNESGSDFIAFLWAPVEGFSSFGLYDSNDSDDGPFVHTGFRPKLVMIKLITTAGANWLVFDTERDPHNVFENVLFASSGAQEENLTTRKIDFVSNGFKLRSHVFSTNDTTSYKYVYAAWAEHPFRTARAR